MQRWISCRICSMGMQQLFKLTCNLKFALPAKDSLHTHMPADDEPQTMQSTIWTCRSVLLAQCVMLLSQGNNSCETTVTQG